MGLLEQEAPGESGARTPIVGRVYSVVGSVTYIPKYIVLGNTVRTSRCKKSVKNNGWNTVLVVFFPTGHSLFWKESLFGETASLLLYAASRYKALLLYAASRTRHSSPPPYARMQYLSALEGLWPYYCDHA